MNKITAAEDGQAPKLLAGWRHLERLLEDGDWHSQAWLTKETADATGIAERTAANLLHDARFTKPPRVQTTGRGRDRRYRARTAHR